MKTCICFRRTLQNIFYILEDLKKYKVELFPSRNLSSTLGKVQIIQDMRDLVTNQWQKWEMLI